MASEDELFGEADVVFRYTDQDAIADGVLVPLLVGWKDTRHRVTSNAYGELQRHYANEEYDDDGMRLFILRELLPLVQEAIRRYDGGDVLKTDYDFRVKRRARDDILWYLPNEVGGITIMKPEDY